MNSTSKPVAGFWRHLLNTRMLICMIGGFCSGLPLFTLLQMVPAWLRDNGVELSVIGVFSLASLPYTWKFLWSFLFDRYVPPFLGRRRGWLIMLQVGLLISIAFIGSFDTEESLAAIATLIFITALFGASQDIVIDAYRRELLPDEELGAGSAFYTNAYRIAGLIPGGLALVWADHTSWSMVFPMVAAFMSLGIVANFFIPETSNESDAPKTLREAVIGPFVEFFNRRNWRYAMYVLAFIFLYKLGDNMATALQSPFYLDMGYSLTMLGTVAKISGLFAMLGGSIVGGALMIKLGINRALWVFGFVQMATILGFAYMAFTSPPALQIAVLDAGYYQELRDASASPVKLFFVHAFEYFGVGLGTVALMAFMAKLSNLEFTATQFALLSSLASLPRVLAGASSGFIIEYIGYGLFFLFCTSLAIPGLLMLLKIAPWNEPDESRA